MALDLKKLSKQINAITPEALHEAGLDRLPVEPNGDLDEALVTAFAREGVPDVEWYQNRKVMTPEAWVVYRRGAKRPEYDPISGRELGDDEKAAWGALAPVRVLGGAVVQQADLAAFAVVKNLIDPDITSHYMRRRGERGAEPLEHCADLAEAARLWPYVREAADIARMRRMNGGGNVAARQLAPQARVREVIGEAPRYVPDSTPAHGKAKYVSREAMLEDLLKAFFGETEPLGRFITTRISPHLHADLPASVVSLNCYVHEVVAVLGGRGFIDKAFFDALVLERPARGGEVTAIRGLWGC